ncbi:hypothetical protein SAMN05216551_106166 [Chitinasiproducens palmae]|uniref:Uncharacterized protein n=1 Tax=Chitinasiproducens palmae TaxID=1770053 RepID=A0A1H2PQ48_9BURK|nr:hypothetical protein SAMN05216551_106166 [Chitinasiproducens palmae]
MIFDAMWLAYSFGSRAKPDVVMNTPLFARNQCTSFFQAQAELNCEAFDDIPHAMLFAIRNVRSTGSIRD